MIRRRVTLAGVLIAMGCAAGSLAAGDGGQAEAATEAAATDSEAGAPVFAGTVSDLTDAQALQLCQWLFDLDPTGSTKPTTQTSNGFPAPGYINGGGFGCPNVPFFWVTLTPDNCVLNLRHSPCAGTVAALEACATYIVSTYVEDQAGTDMCPSWGSTCSPFTSAPSCDETVFQTSPSALGGVGYDTSCAFSLPIQPAVTCPATGLGD
jgi:hypothetical protein